MKKKWFNYRPLCLIFIFLLLGSFFAFHLFKNMPWAISIAVAVFILILINAIVKKNLKYFLVPFIAFIIGVGCYHVAYKAFYSSNIEAPKEIQARIYLVDKPYGNSIYLEADSCVFDGNKRDENIIIYLYDYSQKFENIEIGSVIKFTPSNFDHVTLEKEDSINAGFYYQNLKYRVTASISNVEYLETNTTFSEQIKQTIKARVKNGLTNENVELAYSAMFGEKEMLADMQYDSFKLSGVAHLLAVSGLHVGIIVGALAFFLNRINVKRWGKFSIVATFLMIYAYICNFAVSIIRASIMYLILLLAEILGREYDSLNAISLAGIVIFLINPFSLFDISFLMSFSCVVGIVLMSKSISKALKTMRMPKFLRDGFALSLSTSIALLFIMCYYFANLNIISLIANIILIPLFTIAFVIIFIFSLISLIFPFITYLVYPVNYLLSFINLIANVLGNLPISNLATIHVSFVTILIFMTLLTLLSRICVANRKEKVVITLPIVALLFCCLI